MNRWDIYWADVPFEEDPSQSKPRPVIIAKDKVVSVLVVRITSKGPRSYDPYDYQIQAWQAANLSGPSVVRIRKIAEIEHGRIGNFIGKLQPIDIVGVQQLMTLYKQNRHT